MEDKTIIYADFARKAREKINARKQHRTKKLFVEDVGVELTLRGLTDQELIDVNEYSEDSLKNDKYLVYIASKELPEIAEIMMRNGDIQEYTDVVDMFTRADRKQLAEEVLKLSGVYDESTVKEVDEIKN